MPDSKCHRYQHWSSAPLRWHFPKLWKHFNLDLIKSWLEKHVPNGGLIVIYHARKDQNIQHAWSYDLAAVFLQLSPYCPWWNPHFRTESLYAVFCTKYSEILRNTKCNVMMWGRKRKYVVFELNLADFPPHSKTFRETGGEKAMAINPRKISRVFSFQASFSRPDSSFHATPNAEDSKRWNWGYLLCCTDQKEGCKPWLNWKDRCTKNSA